MPKYSVLIERTVTSCAAVSVEAQSRHEAETIATEYADHFGTWTGNDVDFDATECHEGDSPYFEAEPADLKRLLADPEAWDVLDILLGSERRAEIEAQV